MSNQITKRTLLNSLGVVAYVAIVASIMFNAEHLFGQGDTVINGIAFLLLFCISAATVGSLVFGYPIMLYLNGQKREGVTAVMTTIAWLAALTVLAIGIAILSK